MLKSQGNCNLIHANRIPGHLTAIHKMFNRYCKVVIYFYEMKIAVNNINMGLFFSSPILGYTEEYLNGYNTDHFQTLIYDVVSVLFTRVEKADS